MKQYRCHKIVEAAQITTIRYAPATDFYELEFDDGDTVGFKSGDPIFARFMPEVGDYLVQYADGYRSFSPRAAFEEGYSLDVGESPQRFFGVLMSVDNPSGWKLEDLAPQLIRELMAKSARVAPKLEGMKFDQHLGQVYRNNSEIIAHLLTIDILQRKTMAAIDMHELRTQSVGRGAGISNAMGSVGEPWPEPIPTPPAPQDEIDPDDVQF